LNALFYSNKYSNTTVVTNEISQLGGGYQSANFVSGSTGWRFDSAGNLEANSGTFRGALIANSLDIPNTTTANSFHVDNTGNVWWGNTTLATSTASVLKTGVASFKSITLDTNVIIKDLQAGSVVDGTYINSLNVSKLVTGTISSKQITLGITGGSGDSYINAGKTDFTNTDAGFILGLDDSDSDKAKFYIGSSTKYLNWDGATLAIKGDISGSTITGSTFTTGTTGNNVDITLSRIAQRTGTTEVVYSDVGTYGGFWGLKSLNGTSIAYWQVRGTNTDLSFIVEVGDLYIQLADDVIFVGSSGNDIYPASDNAMMLGVGSNRWSDVKSVLINGADYGFEHNWYLTENYKMGIKENGIAVLNDKNELELFIGESGLYIKGGNIKNLDNLPYVKTTLKQRASMDIDYLKRESAEGKKIFKIPSFADAKVGGSAYKEK
jgi:hypothetical protein